MTTASELISALRQFRRAEETLAGLPVFIRSLSGSERDLLRSRAAAGDPLKPAELVCMGVCDASFAPLFTPEQAADLATGDGGEIDRLAVAILDLSGLGARSAEDAVKN
jgi:hypothetical protein